jgi:hypothetical protein
VGVDWLTHINPAQEALCCIRLPLHVRPFSCKNSCIALQQSCRHCRFDGIITLTRRLSSKFADPRDVHELVINVLRSLFPLWLMPAFRVRMLSILRGHVVVHGREWWAVQGGASIRGEQLLHRCHRVSVACLQAMFARPLPESSNRMVAFATQLTSQWLMGPSEVATEQRPDGTVVSGTTVKVTWPHLKA